MMRSSFMLFIPDADYLTKDSPVMILRNKVHDFLHIQLRLDCNCTNNTTNDALGCFDLDSNLTVQNPPSAPKKLWIRIVIYTTYCRH